MFSLSLGNSSSKYLDYTTTVKSEAKIMLNLEEVSTGSGSDLVIGQRQTTQKDDVATAPCTDFIQARWKLILCFAFALTTWSCAAFQPTDANGPRANAPSYPIALSDLGPRLEEASLAWYQLSQRYGIPGKTEANLHPYTATLESLPANLTAPIYLPKIGAQASPTEDDVRESLRRFIVEWQQLIGAEPNELSLVERADEASGVKVARYEQRPFRYPLRGPFGNLVIRFRSDWQLVGFSSSCIPHADRLQATLAGLTPKLTADEAMNGAKQIASLPENATVEPRELVVYAQPSKDQASGLEIRLAWEIDVTNAPIKKVYLDAISEQIIATS
jgi:hypothetical protein